MNFLDVVGFLLFMIVIGVIDLRSRRFKRLHGVPMVSMRQARSRARAACRGVARCIQFALWFPAVPTLVASFLILGSSRTGKTVLLTLFRRSLLPFFIAPEEEILVIDFDPKRENRFWLKYLPFSVPYFDLSPSVDGVGLDLIGSCQSDGQCVALADSLIPEVKNDTQPHFRNTAVLILASVIRAARRLGHRLSFRELVLVSTDLKDLRKYLRSCPLTAPVVVAHLNDGDEAMSVFSTLSSAMQRYRTVAAAWGHAYRFVTIEEFLSYPKAVLNLPYEDDAVPVLAPIIRLVLLQLEQKILMQNKKNRKIVFIFDEFRILRDVRLTLLACKGGEAGVTLCYACQSVVGATEAHGELITKELFGLAKNRLFLRVDGADDATYVSKSMCKQYGYIPLQVPGGWSQSQMNYDNAEAGMVMNLPLPSDKDLTIRGYGTTPVTGPFELELPFADQLPFLNEAKAVAPLPSRPAAHLDLEPLDRAERQALGL